MTDTDTLTDEQAEKALAEERAASEAVTEPAPEEPEADGADTPETEAEPDAEGKDDQKRVPLAALHEARAKNKELQSRVDRAEALASEARAKSDQLEKTWQAMQERAAQQQPKEPEVPSFDEKPLDHLNARLQQVAELQQHQQAQQQQQLAQQALVQQISGHEAAFIQANPDYYNAVGFAKTARMNELRILGVPEDRLRQTVDAEATQLAVQTMQSGGNPAQVFYDYAKHRGYQKAAQQPAPVVDLKEVREQTKALSSGGGKPPTNRPSLTQISEQFAQSNNPADLAEFDRMFATMKQWQQ